MLHFTSLHLSLRIISFFLLSNRNYGANFLGQAAVPPSDSVPLSGSTCRAVSSSLRHSWSYHQDPTLKRDYMLLEHHWKSVGVAQQNLYCYHRLWTHSIVSHPWRHHVGVMFARHRSCDPISHSISTKNPSSYDVLPRHWLMKHVSRADRTAFPLELYGMGFSAPKPPLAYSLHYCQWLPTKTSRTTLEISFADFHGTVWLVQMSWRPQENISSPPPLEKFLSPSSSYIHPRASTIGANTISTRIKPTKTTTKSTSKIANMVSYEEEVISDTLC